MLVLRSNLLPSDRDGQLSYQAMKLYHEVYNQSKLDTDQMEIKAEVNLYLASQLKGVEKISNKIHIELPFPTSLSKSGGLNKSLRNSFDSKFQDSKHLKILTSPRNNDFRRPSLNHLRAITEPDAEFPLLDSKQSSNQQ